MPDIPLRGPSQDVASVHMRRQEKTFSFFSATSVFSVVLTPTFATSVDLSSINTSRQGPFSTTAQTPIARHELYFSSHGRTTSHTIPLTQHDASLLRTTEHTYIIWRVDQFCRGKLAVSARIPKIPTTPTSPASPSAPKTRVIGEARTRALLLGQREIGPRGDTWQDAKRHVTIQTDIGPCQCYKAVMRCLVSSVRQPTAPPHL